VGALENVTWPDLGNAAYRLGLALLVTIGGAVLLARFGPRTSLWRKLSLQDEQKRDEGYVASKDYRTYIGKTGIALSPLRPAGLGQFGEERLDVVTEGEFIEQNAPIKIIRVEGYRLVVRENKGALK
jgi:membrane-bound serine protease (ClpP class)